MAAEEPQEEVISTVSPLHGDNDEYVGIYRMGKTIGKGSYAVVRRAVHSPSGQIVAIKMYNKGRLRAMKRLKSVQTEVNCFKEMVVLFEQGVDSGHEEYHTSIHHAIL